MTNEIWKEIPDYDGYLVSNYGRVKSFKFKTPRILKPAFNTQGYLFVELSSNNKQKTFRINRLVAEIFIPNPDNKPQVNHINGDKTDNRVENLEWVTGKENMAHALRTGLQKSGSNMYNSKLTDEQVAEILATYVRGSKEFGAVALGKKFGVLHNQILRVVHGQTYRNVEGNRKDSKPRKEQTFLTDEQRSEIRRLYIKGDKERGAVALSKIYGVHSDTIRVIVGAKRR